jgi:regulatory protein
MKIEQIQKKNSKNVILSFDDGSQLILAYELFLKNGFRRNDEISESRFLFIEKEQQKYLIKHAAFKYLSRRIHSARELKTKLLQKKFKQEIIDDVLSDLIKNNYLNDEEFARQFIEEKQRYKAWGRNKIKAELIKRGIKQDIIKQYVEEGVNEEDKLAIEKAAQKKVYQLKARNISGKKMKERLISHLLSKGYDYELVRETVVTLIDDD